MIQIAKVPYHKTYHFPYLSDAMFLKTVTIILSLLIPFFMVYSVNNFYHSYADSVTSSPTFTHDYNYHLTIQTSSSVYVYSSLYATSPAKAISFGYEANNNKLTHTFTVNFQKLSSERVTKVSLIVFFKYSTNDVTDGYGMVMAEGQGYNLADLNVVGQMQVKTGMTSETAPPTSNILSSYGYDFAETQMALQKYYSSYLESETSYLSSNLPTNLMKFSATFKSPSTTFQVSSATILGQLVWSFSQYFPIACVFWLVLYEIIRYLLQENVLKRTVVHDKF